MQKKQSIIREVVGLTCEVVSAVFQCHQ